MGMDILPRVHPEDEDAFAEVFHGLEGYEVRREPPCKRCLVKCPREDLDRRGFCGECCRREVVTGAQYDSGLWDGFWLWLVIAAAILVFFATFALIKDCGHSKRAVTYEGPTAAASPAPPVSSWDRTASSLHGKALIVAAEREVRLDPRIIGARFLIGEALTSAEGVQRDLYRSETYDHHWSRRALEIVEKLRRARALLDTAAAIAEPRTATTPVTFPAAEIVVPAGSTHAGVTPAEP